MQRDRGLCFVSETTERATPEQAARLPERLALRNLQILPVERLALRNLQILPVVFPTTLGQRGRCKLALVSTRLSCSNVVYGRRKLRAMRRLAFTCFALQTRSPRVVTCCSSMQPIASLITSRGNLLDRAASPAAYLGGARVHQKL